MKETKSSDNLKFRVIKTFKNKKKKQYWITKPDLLGALEDEKHKGWIQDAFSLTKNGVNGSFIVDGKTITVIDGQIISIE